MPIARREFMRRSAAAAAGAVAGIPVADAAMQQPGASAGADVKWSKARSHDTRSNSPSFAYLPSFMRSSGVVRRSSPYMIFDRK